MPALVYMGRAAVITYVYTLWYGTLLTKSMSKGKNTARRHLSNPDIFIQSPIPKGFPKQRFLSAASTIVVILISVLLTVRRAARDPPKIFPSFDAYDYNTRVTLRVWNLLFYTSLRRRSLFHFSSSFQADFSVKTLPIIYQISKRSIHQHYIYWFFVKALGITKAWIFMIGHVFLRWRKSYIHEVEQNKNIKYH